VLVVVLVVVEVLEVVLVADWACSSSSRFSSSACHSKAFSSTGNCCNCNEMMHAIMTWT